MARTRYTFYYLQNPNTEEIGYVGMTTEPLSRRLARHMTEALGREHSPNSVKNEWIRHMYDNGLRPLIQELEVSNFQDHIQAGHREAYWIAKMKEGGHYLTNMTTGGAGTPGLSMEVTEEHKEKISKAMSGDYNLDKGIEMRKAGASWKSIYEELGMGRTNFYKLYKEKIEQAL